MKGVIFGSKRSKEDYKAIMNYARITPPKAKTNYVDIAGGDSSLDLSEAVGGVRFNDGKINFKFTFLDEEAREEMKNEIHGKRMNIFLEKEPYFYYDGRINCNKEERNKALFILYVEAQVKPYKFEENTTIHEEILSGNEKKIIIPNSRMPVMPKITVTGNVFLEYDGYGYPLKTGTYEITEVTFYEGFNHLKVSGNGTIKFEYRKGRII